MPLHRRLADTPTLGKRSGYGVAWASRVWNWTVCPRQRPQERGAPPPLCGVVSPILTLSATIALHQDATSISTTAGRGIPLTLHRISSAAVGASALQWNVDEGATRR